MSNSLWAGILGGLVSVLLVRRLLTVSATRPSGDTASWKARWVLPGIAAAVFTVVFLLELPAQPVMDAAVAAFACSMLVAVVGLATALFGHHHE
jgi:hypothetical protein